MEKELFIKSGKVLLRGNLKIPRDYIGLVIFAHGSGSSRKSPRNEFVSDYLNRRGFACLLFDLLTEKEDEIYSNRFDIELLSDRLSLATREIINELEIINLPVFYFGASTGSAAAILSAVKGEFKIDGIVSRGGRPDLVESNLKNLKIPILFLVGGYDEELIRMHESIIQKINSKKKIIIIPEAGHLFEEKGKLLEVAELTFFWLRNLVPEKQLVE